jgi:hypothetical protein
MFAIESLSDAVNELTNVYKERLRTAAIPRGKTIRGPVGLFLIRKDGAFGSKLAKEVVGSFKFWHGNTGQAFDGVFLGWGYDGGPAFMEDAFLHCLNELREVTDWHYSGVADLIVVDFVYEPATERGHFDFSRAMPLNITELLKKKKYDQLSTLIEQMLAPVMNERAHKSEVSVDEISDYLGVLKTRAFYWKKLVERFAWLLGIIDEGAPYARRDIRKDKN